MMNREHARIVGKTLLGENFQGPQARICYRPARRAISVDLHSCRVFDCASCDPGVLAEFLRSHGVDRAVPKTVAGNFVTACRDLTNQVWKFTCHPTYKEKRSLNVVLIKQIQDPLRGCNHARRPSIPGFARNRISKCFHHEVIFYIYGHDVPDRRFYAARQWLPHRTVLGRTHRGSAMFSGGRKLFRNSSILATAAASDSSARGVSNLTMEPSVRPVNADIRSMAYTYRMRV